MRILLIAYEFPPISSAQSLRWAKLAGELSDQGHDVTVLTTNFRVVNKLTPDLKAELTVIRTCPGIFMSLTNRIQARFFSAKRRDVPDGILVQSKPMFIRLYRRLRGILNQVVFPDLRTEWYPFARVAIGHLLRSGYKPDLVVGSHEPAIDIELAIHASRSFGAPSIADLGDPIDTVYSPKWRRRLDRLYEASLIRRVDGITVTIEEARQVLSNRHKAKIDKFAVVPQGFDRCAAPEPRSTIAFNRACLNIVFTGTLYEKFRYPRFFLKKLREQSEVRLWIIGNLVGEFPEIENSESISFLGTLQYSAVREIQMMADVLLSVANKQSEQIPGKIFEYFGAQRPILHVSFGGDDPTAAMIHKYKRGWMVRDADRDCTAVLGDIKARWRSNSLEELLDLDSALLSEFSWAKRAEQFIDFAKKVKKKDASGASAFE